MSRQRLLQSILGTILLGIFLFLRSISVQADEAHYFYDELGRLVGVTDSSGNTAVYTYDEVGNLLSIERFTPGASGIGIFLLSPSSGIVGTTVQIQGYGFSATPADNQVTFNGVSATVTSSTANAIVVKVPDTATTGPVVVTNANGTATSPQPFTIQNTPVIQGIDPDRVAQGSTNFAVISGVNLADATGVTFSNSGITATVLSGATLRSLPITLDVAANVPKGSYSFTVTTPNGTAQSGIINVTVMPSEPAFAVARLSVFMPFPQSLAPSGSTEAAASGLSVFRPFPATVPPSGSSMSVAPPESVSMP